MSENGSRRAGGRRLGVHPGLHGRGLALMAVLAAAAVLLAGCGQPGNRPAGAQVLTGHRERLAPGSLSAGQVAGAEASFGLALFSRVCSQMPAANVLLSPDSAAQALGMLDAGAAGPAATAISRLLRLPRWNPAVVASLHQHSAALARVHQLVVTNDLFEQTGSRPSQHVLDDLRTAYNTELRLVDFGREPAATNTVNTVVSRGTHGLIPALFGQSLPLSTRTVLTNALYLKARWLTPFPSVSPAPFHTAAGAGVQAPMMASGEPVASYGTAAGWQSATLPYTGRDLAAVAILPPATATGCAVPTMSQWTALTTQPAVLSVKVDLPRLHLSQTWDQLQTTLAAMGLPLSGDYAGLGTGDSQISQVVQQATMDVTQQGTTAAAATGVAIGTALPLRTLTLTFNRPFLLVLEDTATHTPLFLARIVNPLQP